MCEDDPTHMGDRLCGGDGQWLWLSSFCDFTEKEGDFLHNCH